MPLNQKALLGKLEKIDSLKIETRIPLKKHTSFRVGGPADIFLTPFNIQALRKTLKITDTSGIQVLFLGKGSNIIVSDKGFRGIVIHMLKLNKIEVNNNLITAESGITLSALANHALEHGLGGLEFASGIPGTLGGAIYMNAGAYGYEMKDIVENALFFDRTGEKIKLNKNELNLSYRNSILQQKEYILIKTTMKLKKKDKNKIEELMNELNHKRKQKQPLNWPSAGSIFKRPPDDYAGRLVEECGLKGMRIGDAQVSEKHAGFIINLGQAQAKEIKKLIEKVQTEVHKKTGILLEPEPRFIGDFE